MALGLALRLGMLLGTMSLAGLGGCAVTINNAGSGGGHARAVGTVWMGNGEEMTPTEPDSYTGPLKVYQADGRSRPHGHGVYSLPSGWTYEGNWKDGNKDGHFIETDSHGTRLEVEYQDGTQIRGEGTIVYDDKTKQVGKWDDVLQRGTGTIDWADGRHYEGEWRNMEWKVDLPDGDGAMTWADGRKYVGGFRDGKPHGAGKMTEAGGKVVEGVWKNGELVGAGKT